MLRDASASRSSSRSLTATSRSTEVPPETVLISLLERLDPRGGDLGVVLDRLQDAADLGLDLALQRRLLLLDADDPRMLGAEGAAQLGLFLEQLGLALAQIDDRRRRQHLGHRLDGVEAASSASCGSARPWPVAAASSARSADRRWLTSNSRCSLSVTPLTSLMLCSARYRSTAPSAVSTSLRSSSRRCGQPVGRQLGLADLLLAQHVDIAVGDRVDDRWPPSSGSPR